MPRRHATRLTAALIIAFAVVGAAAANTQASGTFFGTVSKDAFAGDATYLEHATQRQQQAGIGLLRQTFDWERIEPSRGAFDLTATDRFVLAAARQGIEVMPLLFGEPAWATSRPTGTPARATYPPRHVDDIAAFAEAVARRYGPAGTLWTEHPDVPRRPTRFYQVWNEPNHPSYWAGRPDPHAYARLLSAATRALRRAQPTVRIVSAGLAKSRHGIPPDRYLRELYRAGARRSVDIVAANIYSPSVAGVRRQAEEVRAALPRGARETPLWITETGWASGGPYARGRTVDARSQARLVRDTMTMLWQDRRRLRLLGVVYYAWRDNPVWPGGKDYWGLHTGLVDISHQDKPALSAFRAVARRTSPAVQK